MEQWLEGLPGWVASLREPSLWYQLAVVAVALAGAWLISRSLQSYLARALSQRASRVRRTIRGASRRLVFPLALYLILAIGRAALVGLDRPHELADIALALALALAGVRLVVFLLEQALRPGPLLSASEHVISTLIWVGLALYILGWLDPLLAALDAVGLDFGEQRLSLLIILKVLAAVLLVVVIALWAARLIERAVMSSPHLSVPMRLGITKAAKVFLLALGVVIALQGVGIDLSALTLFGGALGVGLGFGLQRITSNFISGFILISDRSIQPGDVITVTDQAGEERFGWVQELRARYIVVRDRDGVATLIPNENLIVNPVVNWSYGHKSVRLKVPVQISYGDDPERAMELMASAAENSDRVLKDPKSVVRLMGFGDNGIDLELRVWIEDPEEGVNNIRSDLNLAIWRAFQKNGITIPFPQRDLYLHRMPAAGEREG